jgi:outer membrane receptor protein involved in Fe transport
VPRETLNAGLTWRAASDTQLSALLRHVGKQVYDNDQGNTFPSRIPAYATADLVASHTIGRWLLRASINNLLNERYYSYGIRNGAGTSYSAYPQRERNYLATAEYRF